MSHWQKLPWSQVSLDQYVFGQLSLGQRLLGKGLVGQMSLGPLSFGEILQHLYMLWLGGRTNWCITNNLLRLDAVRKSKEIQKIVHWKSFLYH